MKNKVSFYVFIRFYLWVLLSIITLSSSCKKDDNPVPNPDFISSELTTVPFFVETTNGQPPSAPDQKLFETRTHAPIIAPDGHQLTWEEFDSVEGMVAITCLEEGGTKVVLALSGLVPQGVYTIWNVTFQSPGFDPDAEGFNLIGLGAAGKGDGSDNYFVASAKGRATIELVSPADNLSMMGSIAGCALTDEVEWHIVGALHMDGQTHGADLGPDGSVVEQFALVHKR